MYAILYLIHPIIIRTYYFQKTSLLHYSPVQHLTTFVAMRRTSLLSTRPLAPNTSTSTPSNTHTQATAPHTPRAFFIRRPSL